MMLWKEASWIPKAEHPIWSSRGNIFVVRLKTSWNLPCHADVKVTFRPGEKWSAFRWRLIGGTCRNVCSSTTSGTQIMMFPIGSSQVFYLSVDLSPPSGSQQSWQSCGCHTAHQSARVSACTAGLKTRCLPCKSSQHHSKSCASNQSLPSWQWPLKIRHIAWVTSRLGPNTLHFSWSQATVCRVRRRRYEEARSDCFIVSSICKDNTSQDHLRSVNISTRNSRYRSQLSKWLRRYN